MEKFGPDQPKNEKNLEQKLIERGFQLIKTNQDFEYVVSISGNLTGRGQMAGQEDFHFDQKTQKIEKSNTGDNGEYIPLDINPLREGRLEEGKTRFEIKDWKRKKDGKEFRHYIWRLAFNGRTPNKFTNDSRPGVHISTALRVLKDKKIFDECGEQKLKEYLAQDTPESRKFFSEFLSRCNQEFIPDYWQYVLTRR